MADLTVKRGDTWPPLRGQASDEDGLMDLTLADSMKVFLKSSGTTITGTAVPIDPPDSDDMNWKYIWQDGDTDVVATYDVELQITWDSGSTPPQIETVPNTGFKQVAVVQDLAD